VPVRGAILYLGKAIKANDGRVLMIAFDKSTAPKAETDIAGKFMFTDVPDDYYGLILDLITSSIVLHDPVTKRELLIEVKSGDVVDLGQLIYQDLPFLPYAKPR